MCLFEGSEKKTGRGGGGGGKGRIGGERAELGREGGSTASENKASLAALMQHERLWEDRQRLTGDAFNSSRHHPFCVVLWRSLTVPLWVVDGPLIKRPSSNCIFAPGVIVVLHYTVAYSPPSSHQWQEEVCVREENNRLGCVGGVGWGEWGSCE